MVAGLVDSSVIIDLIRGYPVAVTWLSKQTELLEVTRYVWLEVIQGAPNKGSQLSAIKILSDFRLINDHMYDTRWAVKALTQTSLAHNTDALDSLIASAAFRLQCPLYTRNLKHFRPLLDDLAVQPY